MKKMMALVLALVMVLVMTACGDGLKRDSKGYLTEDSARIIAAQSVGYSVEDVAFAETKFEGDSAGGDENAYFFVTFSDSVAEYSCKVKAIDGTVFDSSAK